MFYFWICCSVSKRERFEGDTEVYSVASLGLTTDGVTPFFLKKNWRPFFHRPLQSDELFLVVVSSQLPPSYVLCPLCSSLLSKLATFCYSIRVLPLSLKGVTRAVCRRPPLVTPLGQFFDSVQDLWPTTDILLKGLPVDRLRDRVWLAKETEIQRLPTIHIGWS